MKQKIKIKTVGFGIETKAVFEKSFLYPILSSQYYVQWEDKNPDVILYSWYNNDFLNYDCPKIFLASEHFFPSVLFADIVISNRIDNKKEIFSNIVLLFSHDGDKVFKSEYFIGRATEPSQFCNFIYSNRNSKTRNVFIDKMLVKFGDEVHSWGRYRRNIESLTIGNETLENMSDNIEIMKHYKFTICFENSSMERSFSEKAIYALIAGSVPIYWGGSDIYKYIKKEAFIDANDFPDLDSLIAYIEKVNNDDVLYKQYLVKKPWINSDFITSQYPENVGKKIKDAVDALPEKRKWYKRGYAAKIIFYFLNFFYRKYWRLKSLKRRFIGGH